MRKTALLRALRAWLRNRSLREFAIWAGDNPALYFLSVGTGFECYRLITTASLRAHNACMDRDISWQRIAIAVLVGCAVFASAKFAYGFQVSIKDIIGIVICLAVVFGLAGLVLVFSDNVTLKPNMSAEEREAATAKRSNRLRRGWAVALFIMALIALPLHAFGVEHEPLWQRLLYLGLAAFIVVNFLLSWHRSRKRVGSGNGGLANNRK